MTLSISRRLCAWIVAAALALQALIPLGFMPGFTAKAGPTFVICGHAHKAAPAPDKTPEKKNGSAAPSVCPFSVAGHLFTPVAPVALTAFAAFSVAVLPHPDFRLPREILFGNAAPRAPPAFS